MDNEGDRSEDVGDYTFGYGRGNRHWRGTIGRFFPAEHECSRYVVCCLLRADEIRLSVGRTGELLGEITRRSMGPQGTGLSDPTTQLWIAFRQTVLSIADLHDHAESLLLDPEFNGRLAEWPEGRNKFHDDMKEIRKFRKTWKEIRHSTCAHLDPDRIAQTLATRAENGRGGVWIGRRQGDYSFDIATCVLICSMHRDAPADDAAAQFEAMKTTVSECSQAAATAHSLVWIIMQVYHRITGRFFPWRAKR